MPDSNFTNDYSALTERTGFVELKHRTVVQLTGEDRHTFLQNFCTNDIKKLEIGRCCEAFVLNTKGKILAYVHVIAQEDRMLLTGHGDQGTALVEHLDKYLIREDVELADLSQEFASVFVCGKESSELLSKVVPNLPAENETVTVEIGGVEARLSNLEIAGQGFLLTCPKDSLNDVNTALIKADIQSCSPFALEAVRIRNVSPWFGVDVDDSNLPQELQRDEKAISFDKGCYLGQETVARIDAIGRVNQLIVGFEFENEEAAKVGEFESEGKAAGRVTSIVDFPTEKQGTTRIGMGYIRRKFNESGTNIAGVIVR